MMAMQVLAPALIGCRHNVECADFNSQSIAREEAFQRAMEPDFAFPLLTAPGETLWVAGWEPHILRGDGYEEGTDGTCP